MTSPISLKLVRELVQRLKDKQQVNAHDAFTLVELLVVVAIVGILSAVALPNFLSQTDKAKATEAKTHLASTLKQAHAKFLEDGEDPETTNENMNSTYGTPLDNGTNFDYTQRFNDDDNIWVVTATGNDNDSGLNGKEISGCVNFDTGKVDIGRQLADTALEIDCN